MRILYTNFHPRNGGGHATYVASLAHALQGAHSVSVATPGGSRLYSMARQIDGVQALDTSYSTRPLPMVLEVQLLRQLIKEGDYDVIHTNGSADHRQVMLACAGLRYRPLVVWTKHNTMPIKSMGNWLRAHVATDGAIGVSDFVSNILLQSAFAARPIRTIRHGVDTQRFRPRGVTWRERERLALLGELAPDSLVLASVGGTDREKGWLYLARAIAQLPSRLRARVRLVVAGDPPQGNLLADLQALNLGAGVVFPGLVPDPERILSLADVGFVLSDHEACSFAACESLATGLPTLVSNAGGLPEVVRDGLDGWVCPVGDVAALVQWLRARLADGVDENMGKMARDRALQEFSMAVFARRTVDFYAELLQ